MQHPVVPRRELDRRRGSSGGRRCHHQYDSARSGCIGVLRTLGGPCPRVLAVPRNGILHSQQAGARHISGEGCKNLPNARVRFAVVPNSATASHSNAGNFLTSSGITREINGVRKPIFALLSLRAIQAYLTFSV